MSLHIHSRFQCIPSATRGLDCARRVWPRPTALATPTRLVASCVSDATSERVSSFEPSEWANFFVEHKPELLETSEECMRARAEKLKEDVSLLFKTLKNTVVEKMTLLDTLQRLGIEHLFQEEINTAMNEIHEAEFTSRSLYYVALRFRLLREHGLWVSPDVFNKFKGEDGRFNKDITSEPRGLLSLYNAAYLSVHGEPELDDAIYFARHHLESFSGNLGYPLSEQVKRNLEIPLPRTLKRVDAPCYIAEYGQEIAYNPSILELAKLDFNLLQRLHQRELKDFCWWGNHLYEELGLSNFRHRTVEIYLWCYTIHYEQEYARARIILAKICTLVTLLDDTYDMQATLEEGRKINEAIQRWDDSAIPILPEYMKKYYVKLMNTFGELENELKEDQKYRVVYCRKALQILSRHYQQESEWFHSSCIPSFHDQIKNSVITTTTPTIVAALLIGMGDEATEETFKWAIGCTDVLKACAEITRFMNDMTAFQHGKNKRDAACSVDSYVKEYQVTGDVAMAAIDNLVEHAWRATNQARFDRPMVLPIIERVVRLSKSMTLMYRGNINLFTFTAGNKDMIQQHFVEAITL